MIPNEQFMRRLAPEIHDAECRRVMKNRPAAQRFVRVVSLVIVALGAAAAPVACGRGDGGAPASGTPGALFSCADFDVKTEFSKSCGSASCHDAEEPAAGLDLVSPGLESRIVGALATQCTGILAGPADPEASVLYDKLREKPSCGARMPISGDPWTTDQMKCMRDWISGLVADTDSGNGSSSSTGGSVGDCVPFAVEPCYTGPMGTSGVGICMEGSRTCNAMGEWGPCLGDVKPSIENCSTSKDENCDGDTPPCSDEWSIGLGNPSSQEASGVAVDSHHNVFVVGTFQGAIDFGGGALASKGPKTDVYLAKYDRNGNYSWAKTFGDTSTQTGHAIAVDGNDNVVIVGRAFGTIDFGGGLHDAAGADDVYIAKLDAAGNHVWSRMVGGIDPDRAERVSIAPNGDVLVTGTFTNAADFGAGSVPSAGLRDAFVLRLAGATGALLYQRVIGGPGDDYGWGVGADAAGNVFVAGNFENVVTLGNTTLTSNGDADIYLAKLDSTGEVVWAKSHGGAGPDRASELRVDHDGSVVVSGFFSNTITFGDVANQLVSAGSRDIFVARLGNDGHHVMSKSFGDAADQLAVEFEENTWDGLELDEVGNIYIAGRLAGKANFGGNVGTLASAGKTDVFFVKFDPMGNALSGRRYGKASTELALDVAVDPMGYVVLAGRMFSDVDFGSSGHVTSRGGTDAFIAKIKP